MFCLLHPSAGFSRLRKNSMSRLIGGGAALQCVCENSFLGNPVERNARKSSPGGATELSPALQRWEKWKERFKSRRDDRVLTHTLQRCDIYTVLNAALAAEVTVLARERSLPQPLKSWPLKTRSNPDCFRSLLVREARGSALLEFAIILPLLVVFVVGIYDFSGAFNQKQKIEQAAQEGAIIAGAQPVSDIASTTGDPDSLHPVVTAIFNSLVGSGVVPNGTCTPPGTAAGGPNLTWTYSIAGCPDTLSIVINRGSVPATGPPAVVCTVVTVAYPYHWRFNRVIQLLIPGASYAAITQVTESATVHNQM